MIEIPEAPAIIRFTADWCSPCKTFGPIFDEVVAEHRTITPLVVDIETEDGRELARSYKVLGIPTLAFITDEAEPQVIAGAWTRGQLHSLIMRMFGVTVPSE